MIKFTLFLGILHLDIHVGNLLWDNFGNIKVIDFGYGAHIRTINDTALCFNPLRRSVSNSFNYYCCLSYKIISENFGKILFTTFYIMFVYNSLLY